MQPLKLKGPYDGNVQGGGLSLQGGGGNVTLQANVTRPVVQPLRLPQPAMLQGAPAAPPRVSYGAVQAAYQPPAPMPAFISNVGVQGGKQAKVWQLPNQNDEQGLIDAVKNIDQYTNNLDKATILHRATAAGLIDGKKAAPFVGALMEQQAQIDAKENAPKLKGLERFVNDHAIQPVTGLIDTVKDSTAAHGVRAGLDLAAAGAAAVTSNDQAKQNALKAASSSIHTAGKTFIRDATPPPQYIMVNGKKQPNPAFQEYIQNVAMGADGGGASAAKGGAKGAAAKAGKAGEDAKPIDILENGPKPMASADLDRLKHLDKIAKEAILTPEQQAERKALQAHKDAITKPAAPAPPAETPPLISEDEFHAQNRPDLVTVSDRPQVVDVTERGPRTNVRQEVGPEPQGIDYTQVDGAGLRYKQAVQAEIERRRAEVDTIKESNRQTGKTDLFDRIRKVGGISSSDFESLPNHLKRKAGQSMDRVAQKLGFESDEALYGAIQREQEVRKYNIKQQVPKAADIRAAAERHVAEHSDYAPLRRLVEEEKRLADYAAADKQSGYSKAKFKQNDKGRKDGLTQAQVEKVQSPEYAVRKSAGEFLQQIRDELKPLQDSFKVYDRQRKALGKSGKLDQVIGLNEKYAQLKLRQRYLEGLERQYAGEYGRAARALDEAYPETALYRDGKVPRNTVNVSDEPTRSTVTVNNEPVQVTDAAVSDGKPYSLEEALGHPLNHEPYKGPNLNEGAFSPEDIKQLEAQGLETAGDGSMSYSPAGDFAARDTAPDLLPRNLAGDTAAFHAILDGKSLEEAAIAYRKASGATEAEARQAVGTMAETGAGMGTAEEVLKRNPAYGKVIEAPITSAKDAADQATSYGRVMQHQLGYIKQLAKGLDSEDIALLDHLRGNSIEDVAAGAKNPELFTRVATETKNLTDYIHEIRRMNGDDTIYRQNYGAGMHLKVETPEDQGFVAELRSSMANTPGWSNARHFNNYDDIASQFNLERKNPNFIEDLGHDVTQAKYFAGQRSLIRTIGSKFGSEKVSYGAPTRTADTQLKGFKDVFTTKDIARTINKLAPSDDRGSWLWKPYDAASSLATQAIVLNPLFHGANQLVQATVAAGKIPFAEGGRFQGGPLGTARLVKSMTEELSPRQYHEWTSLYLLNRGHIPTYGSGRGGIIARLTHGASDVNRNAMSGIEGRLRVGLFKASVEGGMDAGKAVRNIDHFLGDASNFGAATQRFTLFLHYFKTMGNALISHVTHPIENAGATVNLLIAAGAVYALSKGYAAWTGNKDAYVRAPGELSLAKELYKAGVEVREGHYRQAASVVTNRVNPVLKEGAQQLFGEDLYTGKQITDRKSHAEQGLLAPAQTSAKVTAGKKSMAETGMNQLGLYTPHAKGNQAAPNQQFLNTPNAQAGTGYREQQQYFDNLEKAGKIYLADSKDKAAFDYLHAHDDGTGKSGLSSARNETYLSRPSVFKADQYVAKHTPGPHDPLYDLNDNQVMTYLVIQHLKATDQKNSDAAKMTKDSQSWLRPLEDARSKFYGSLPAGDNPSVTNPDYTYQFPDPTHFGGDYKKHTGGQDLTPMFDEYDKLEGADKAQYMTDHPELQKYFDDYSAAYAKQRQHFNEPALDEYPKADAPTQAIINEYNALPKNDGPKGGSKTRSIWIKNNPDKWAAMTTYFTNVSKYNLEQDAVQARYADTDFSQMGLSAIYNLGQYDIKKTAGVNGAAATYAFSTGGDNAATGGGGAGSSTSLWQPLGNGAFRNKSTGKYYNPNKLYVPYKAIKQGTAKIKTHKVTIKSGAKVRVASRKVRITNRDKDSNIRVT